MTTRPHIGLHYRPGRTFEFRCPATGLYQALMTTPQGDMALLQRALISPPDTRSVWGRLVGAPAAPRKPQLQRSL